MNIKNKLKKSKKNSNREKKIMKMAREFTGADNLREEMITTLNDFIKLQDKKINQILKSSIKNYYEEIRNIMNETQFTKT